jgi:hypothetical protein
MKDVSRNCIFILYAPAMDRSFAYPASAADHLIWYDSESKGPDRGTMNYPAPGKKEKRAAAVAENTDEL